ncbi:MAG TPA: pyruvate dehydrogenase (acetyl-transferring) E1 component subunit alpha [Armatimonadota bacterium]|jgi:pyruvate dehydrogenase E1 component alpha subunit
MDREQGLKFYRQMVLIRLFEDKAGEQYGRGKIGGFLHLYIGEEACAVGAINALRHEDYVITHYRDHGHAIVKGCSPRNVMAELYGKATGVSHGMGGSMHLFCAKNRLMGGYAIVGGGLPIGTGIALGIQHRKENLVCLNIFGDGAVNEGEFHESLNLAALWKLPVVFFCENNQYAMGTPLSKSSAVPEIYKRAEAYAMSSQQVDGMDVDAVHRAAVEAVERARRGGGPSLIEAITYRYKGHSMADAVLYRTREEEEGWRPRDPIALYRHRLLEQGMATEEALTEIERQADAIVADAVQFAEESPEPTLDEMYRDVYAA